MIKKIFTLLAVFAFALGILFISVHKSTVSAVTSGSNSVARLKPTAIPTSPPVVPTTPPKVDYFMAYPGVLPDSPIYKLKMIRDKFWLWLTTDSVKKGELLLHYADKRVGAAKALIEGNQVPLGIETLTKGEKYLEQSIWEAEKAKKNNKDLGILGATLRKATLKHEEIILELKSKVNGEGETLLGNLLTQLKNLQEKIKSL